MLTDEADEVIVEREVTAPWLFELAFDSETKRIWNGFGRLKTLDGREWDGVGELVGIDAISPSFSGSAPPGRVSISGVTDEAIARAMNATEYRDRLLTIYVQPFQGMTLYGNPVPISTRVMKSLPITRDENTRTIAVEHEGPYTGRHRPAAGWYSDRDQKKRHPGDRFCEWVWILLFQKDKWPYY